METTDRWTAPEEAAGERLDSYLALHYETPRNRVLHWIKDGRVSVDGQTPKASLRLTGGELLQCTPAVLTQGSRMEPEEGELAILYEDSEIAAIDKPAGLVMHPGAGNPSGTLAHRLLARYPETDGVGGPGRPGIVHRLDRDTTGVCVIARTPGAYESLSRAFAAREVEKTYLALAYGAPSPGEGVIDAPIGRHPKHRREMGVVPHGRPAVTRYRVLRQAGGIALVEVTLETGRTHQVRVHLKHSGWPLVGDPVYGEARWRGLPRPIQRPLRDFPRPALHAWRLGLEHPSTGKPMRFESAPPPDIQALWEEVTNLEWKDPAPSP